MYLANDVIQNSKRKGPEFTKDFAPVIVEAFKHVSRYSAPFLSLSNDVAALNRVMRPLEGGGRRQI